MTITHEDLMRITCIVDPATQCVFAVDPMQDNVPTFVANQRTVAPDFRNLIGAAHLLYRTNAEIETGLQTLIELLEAHGGDALVNSIQQMASSLNVARRCAIEGLEKIAAAKN